MTELDILKVPGKAHECPACVRVAKERKQVTVRPWLCYQRMED